MKRSVSYLIALLLMLCCGQLAGCIAAKIAKLVEGVDASSVQPRSSRADIEKILGAPIREWISDTKIQYALYEFDGGYPGDKAGAAGWVALDIATLGGLEIANAIMGSEIESTMVAHTRTRLVVSYDDEEVVLGVFEEYAILPEDGRSETTQTRQ